MPKFDLAKYWDFRVWTKSQLAQVRKLVMDTQQSDTSGSVTTEKLADGAVTTPKIYRRAVTSEKIAERAVTSEHIAPKTITEEHLSQALRDKINDDAGYVWAFKLENEVSQVAEATTQPQTTVYKRI